MFAGRASSRFTNFFDRVAGAVEDYSDLLAERAGGLGSAAYGTVQIAAERSFLIPYPLCIADCSEHIFAISSALAAFGQSTREAIGLATSYADADTADLFTEVSRGVDQQLWLVEFASGFDMNQALPKGRGRESAAGEPEAGFRRQSMRERVEIWVNEGGAGGDDENRGAGAPAKDETL